MDVEQFLARLRSLDVKLRLDGERLRLSAPPGALTEDLHAEIAARKGEILHFLQTNNPCRRPAPPLQPIPRDKPLPLSFGQQRFWFLQQLEPESAAYNISAVIRHTGVLDVRVVERCLSEITRRHEVLRTSFPAADGQPVQQIAPAEPVVVPVVDLQALPESAREVEASRLTQEEAQVVFDLAHGPLWRAKLLRLGAELHIFFFTVHHIVCDWWSLGIFFREFAALESAFIEGRPSPLPELPVQCADYASWQRAWFQGDVLAEQLDYWKRQLGGSLPALNLPTDRPRPALQSYRSRGLPVTLPAELSDALQKLSQQEGVTLYITLVAALSALLQRYSDQDDILLGTPVANRNHVETERLIGFFINTLVLRTNLSGNPTFRELLQRTREIAMGAYAHQDIPFEKLVEELQPERDLSRSPLFQVMFVLHNVPNAVSLPDKDNLRFTASGASTFDLSIELRETDQGLIGNLDYNVDLFDDTRMQRLVEHWRTLLAAIVTQPDCRLADLPLLSTAERQQLLGEFGAPGPAAVPAALWPAQFEAQVERSPEAVAVWLEEQQLSYRELNERANRLAQQLRRLGVGPGRLVLVYLERSIEVVVALVGILKAGGVYVPLETEAPVERLAFMLADTQAAVIVTQQRVLATLPAHTAQVVCLEAGQPVETPGPWALAPDGLRAQDLAYVIYTSGSTGQPKGVMIAHGALAQHVRAVCEQYALRAEDGVLQFSSLSFDASLEQILPALTVGARVVLRGKELWALRDFATWLERYRLTVVDLPTAYWHQLAQEWAESTRPAAEGLRLVIVGGEAMLPESLELWASTPWRRVRLLNAYGPTEGTITTTVYEASPPAAGTGRLWRVPIGRPLPGKPVYILDRHEHCVPVGIVGELHLGGWGVASGYWRRPELTGQRFIADTLSGQADQRLYKTGDWARYLEDGNIEFLGRADDQVKIRGFRVELGEIETVLGQHPGVRQSVVLASEETAGQKRLAAYVVAAGEPAPTANELRHFVKSKLPEYMIPGRFVLLPELPQTVAGKVDRKALARLKDDGGPEAEGGFVAARDPLELQLANIWEKVLGRSPISMTENFFALGGHSLLATQVISRIRNTLHADLPLRLLFESPTLVELARSVRQAIQKSRPGKEWLLQPVPRTGDLPLSFGQERIWFLDQLEEENKAYNIPVSIRHNGPLDLGILEKCLSEIARRHEILRTTFTSVDGQPVQVITPASPVMPQIIDLRALSEAEREAEAAKLAQKEAEAPFDLARGPLWRVNLIVLGDQAQIFLLTMHHIISDAWSMGLFFRELQALESAFIQGKPSPLPELPIQFADYAQWQRRWFQGEVLDEQLAYWKKQLAGPLPTLELPMDRPRPRMQTYRSRCHQFRIEPPLAKALKQLSQREGVTLFMTTLAAFNALLSRYTGQEDILLGTPIADRSQVETERLIGFFLNTLVLRTDLSGNPTFRELLGRVRKMAMGAYAHQDMPFDRLIDELQPERNLSRSPVFQVMFILQNVPKAVDTTTMPSIVFSATGASAYELCLELVDTDQDLIGGLDYNVDLFDDTRMQRLVEHWRTLLAAIVTQPDCRLADLPLLSTAERQQLLGEFGAPGPAAVPAALWPAQFEAQVERSPEAVAVWLEEQQLSYRELNERANRLAQQLRRLGVGPGRLVLVYLERSIEVVVALVGILKAGGVYVPLETEAPVERLAFMLADTQAAVIVTQQRVLATLPAHTAQVVCLEAGQPVETPGPWALAPDGLRAQDLAYVIYTSGSTGQPKGVMIAHGALAQHVRAVCEQYALRAEDGVLQFSSLSFDASLEQILPALTVGARVVLRGKELWALRDFATWLERYRLTVVDLPTAYWHQLAQEWAESTRPAAEGLRLVIVGGEAMLPESLELWASTPWRRVRLLNAYGPTEGTITTTVYEASPPAAGTGRLWRVPIGRPLPGKPVYILDRHEHCVPVGIVGELHLGGWGVASGYWRRPELTGQRFIADTLSGQADQRLYKTGDWARYLEDGNIEFLGRADDQVKIRGFRVELGEIETVLGQHPGVRQSVVLASEETAGQKRLAAYVVAAGEPAPTANELRHFVKSKLPEYMIPGRFVLLPELPQTVAGKVDRKALARLKDDGGPEAEGGFVAARDPLELQLANIWEKVLGRSPISMTENFFDAGGHSLLAVRLFALIEKTVGKHLPLATLYSDSTIERQAAIIRDDGWQAPWASLVPIRPGGSQPPFFIVHGVGGNILWCRDLVNRLAPDQPCYGVQSQGLNPDMPAHNRVEDMASHYLKDIRNLQSEGPYYLGGFCMGGMVAFEIARQLEAAGERVGMVALLEAHGPDYFLDPAKDIQYFYEDRTLFQRVMINVGRLRSLSREQRGVFIQSKLLIVRDRVGVLLSGVVTRILLRFGHRTLAALHRVHQGNIDAQIHYSPKSPLAARVDLFQCEKQPVGDYQYDPLFGWGPFTTGGVEVHTIPGWHSTLLREPYVSVFAEQLRQGLREAQVPSVDQHEAA